MGDSAGDIRLALFVDASFAADLDDSKSTSGVWLCLVGPRTFIPITWMCKKQGAVSHSSTEAEVISLDAGIRLEGLPSLMLWDVILETCVPAQRQKGHTKHLTSKQVENPLHRILTDVDYVPCTLPLSKGLGKLIVLSLIHI